LATGGFSVGPLLHLTKTIPIVFVSVTDPLGSGFITSISRPGRNATGFTNFEYSMSAKWLELLKQVAPSVKRAVVIRNPGLTSGGGQFGAIQAVSTFLGIEVIPVDARNVEDIERSVTKLAHEGHGGLIVTADPAASIHRELIISMTARNKLPTVFPFRYWVVNGGLISYGPDALDYYRRAASYIDRILKGEKPADLPVQAPTKYETVLNLKTAKALGLDIPASVLARADEVIE
jgi:putative ABC transport system substrate-binding protein